MKMRINLGYDSFFKVILRSLRVVELSLGVIDNLHEYKNLLL